MQSRQCILGIMDDARQWVVDMVKSLCLAWQLAGCTKIYLQIRNAYQLTITAEGGATQLSAGSLLE